MKIVAALAAGALLVSACTAAEESEQAGSQQVEIIMTEFAFDPDQVTVAAGQETTIVLSNEGDVPHEFMAGRQAMPDNGGYVEDLFASLSPSGIPPDAVAMDAHDAHAGFMVQVEPGETVEVTFTLPEDRAGEWEVGCFEPGHYEAGMRATLIVTG